MSPKRAVIWPYWMIFELLWRDYFRFIALKHGNKIFHKRGLGSQPRRYRNDKKLFRRWCQGETGQTFIDANMRELATTGFMSNRGRQNVASYLVRLCQTLVRRLAYA